MEKQLEELVAAVLAAAKYRHVSPDFVRAVGARELAIRPNLKAAIKATKNVLHQAGGAFQDAPIDYARALARLQEAAAVDPSPAAEPLRAACRAIMAGHTSTRERLPILDTFFATTLAAVPPLGRVLDVACGLNPLARPWMPLPPTAEYVAYDIYGDQIDFLNHAFALLGYPGRAEVRDVIGRPPSEPADVALVLKTLPCLEAVDRHAPARLLDTLDTPLLLVSFPAQSLGGRRKGMAAHYEARFMQLVNERGWLAERFEFQTELAFLVRKN
ncbi:Ribosomal RNA methyltransferase [Candidatus Promineifilum breve]|uniref:16S rRNA (guanine(1405)-N(7))-methyltransferase n=1 Tax=Candidatus Promineifilum breve TaxID=1806508 RepID=A0A160T494_9CHLR|nr:16S rRNA methyltransferase [Candidatus Promineifilum breve]CUS04654.2 Ribosomal RNA methyltransferase [Candidatus Promineifilum breve]